MEIKITNLIKKGTLSYTETYNCTLTSQESMEHDLPVPQHLATLAKSTPQAEVIIFGDETLGIEIDGDVWAVEQPHEMRGCLKGMPAGVWRYLNAAMGRQEFADSARRI